MKRWHTAASVLSGVTLLVGGAGALAKAHGPAAAIRVRGAAPSLNTVAFFGRHGYLGGAGAIWVTADGGRHWLRSWSGSAEVTQIDPVTASHAVAVTRNGLWATANGGRTWRPLDEPDGAAMCTSHPNTPCLLSVDFVSPTQGYGVGALPAQVGTQPTAVTLSPGATMLYVANGSGTVTAYNLDRGRIAWAAKVGETPGGMAVSPGGRYLYVTDQNANALTTVDTRTHRVVATVPTLANPCAVAVKPGGAVYVSGSGGLERFRAAPGVRAEGRVAGVAGACSLAFGPGAGELYNASSTGSAVEVVDARTNRLVHTFAVGSSANAVVPGPQGKSLFVAALGDGPGSAVMKLNAQTGAVEHRWTVPGLVWSLAADWSRHTLLAVRSNHVDAIDLATGQVRCERLASSAMFGSAVAEADHRLYVPQPIGVWQIRGLGAATLLKTSGVLTTDVFGSVEPESGGTLWETRNGGKTWSLDQSAPALQSVSALAGGDLLASRGPDIWQSSDGGRAWVKIYQAPVRPDPLSDGLTSQVASHGRTVAFEITGWGAAMMHDAYIAFQSTDGGAHFVPAIEEGYTHPGRSGIQAPEGPGTYPGPFAVAGSVPVWSGSSPAVPSAAIGVRRDHALVSHVVPAGGAALNLAALAFVTPELGYVLTTQDRLLATEDGGASWHQVFPMHPSPTTAISFVTAKLGYGLGTGGNPNAILRTEDGGKTWRTVGTLPKARGFSATVGTMQFLNGTTGFALNAAGDLYETRNGGQTWIHRHLQANALAFVGSTGCVLTSKGADISRNGGVTWKAEAIPAPPSALTCAAVAAYPRWQPVIRAQAWNSPLVAVIGPRVAWFGGAAAALKRTTDGGRTDTVWAPGQTWLRLNPRDFDFLTPDLGYFLSLDGSLYRTTNGGQRWTIVP